MENKLPEMERKGFENKLRFLNNHLRMLHKRKKMLESEHAEYEAKHGSESLRIRNTSGGFHGQRWDYTLEYIEVAKREITACKEQLSICDTKQKQND